MSINLGNWDYGVERTWHCSCWFKIDRVRDRQYCRNVSLPHNWPLQRGSTTMCEHQALAQGSAPHVMAEPWTLLPHCLRHSRHHILPTPICGSDYSRCQHRPLIRSVHNKIAVCLSSSLTCFSVSCWATAHAMEIVSSCLYHPFCHSPPHSANLYQTQLLAKVRLSACAWIISLKII